MASRRGPDNSAKITIQGTVDTNPFANGFALNLTPSGSVTSADFTSLVTAVGAAYKTAFQAHQNGIVDYVLARGVYFAPGGTELLAEVAMSGAGSSGGTAIDDISASIVISWLSSVYWRGGKPRTYLPGVESGMMASGHRISSGSVSTFTTQAASFLTAVNALTESTISATRMGFISFFSGNALRATPVFYAITGATVHPRLGSQRRRLGKWAP